jgi:hypothetical protein
MEKSLVAAGFVIGAGTSSDIMHLQSPGIACFNLGVGYSTAHTPGRRADLRILERQLERFPSFYNGVRNKLFMDESINRKKENKLWLKL